MSCWNWRTKKENSQITYSSEGILITPSFIVPRESHLSWTIFLHTCEMHLWGFPGSSAGKESAFSTGDQGLIPELGRSSREGNGYPLQHSCLENPQGQRSLEGYPVHGVTKSRTQLSDKAQHNTIHLSSQTMEENRESLIKWYSETESYSSSSIFKWNITSNAVDFFPTFWFRWRLPPSLSFPGSMVMCCTD